MELIVEIDAFDVRQDLDAPAKQKLAVLVASGSRQMAEGVVVVVESDANALEVVERFDLLFRLILTAGPGCQREGHCQCDDG